MSKINFVHVRSGFFSIDPRGGLTVGYREEGNTIRYALAKVNPTDVYCKKTGRDLVIERLSSDKTSWVIDFDFIKRTSGVDGVVKSSIINTLTLQDFTLRSIREVVLHAVRHINHIDIE
jgi:hypothetical protein